MQFTCNSKLFSVVLITSDAKRQVNVWISCDKIVSTLCHEVLDSLNKVQSQILKVRYLNNRLIAYYHTYQTKQKKLNEKMHAIVQIRT